MRSFLRYHPAPLPNDLIDRRDILERQAFPLVFPPKNIPELDEILQERHVIVRPILLVPQLCLDPPLAGKFLRTNLPFLPFFGNGLPYVDVSCVHALLF